MASIVDTSVKHAYSSMTGAPIINGTAGSLIAALKAFLVTGWGAKSVDSATISNGVCRLVFASGKSAAELHAVITVSGASPAALNGEQRVTAVANGWIEFKTALPDGAVTGSISFKMAGLGWEEVFSKTNVSVFRPTDPASTRTYYRVDDSNPLYVRVQMYESMSDVDSGVGVAPALAGGYYWHKRAAAGAAGVYWVLVGDSRGFYYLPSPYISTSPATTAMYAGVATYAGDIISDRSGDAWCGLLTGNTDTDYRAREGCIFQGGSAAGRSLTRASHGLGAAMTCDKVHLGSGGVSGAVGALGAFPSRSSNGLYLVPIVLTDGAAASGPRGILPGAYFCPQSGLIAGLGFDVGLTPGSGPFAGKILLSAAVGDAGSTSSLTNGLGFFDITTPWRP